MVRNLKAVQEEKKRLRIKRKLEWQREQGILPLSKRKSEGEKKDRYLQNRRQDFERLDEFKQEE